tara:strand:+ start:417 stop:545 length:129 start_codon:yes stop_codon:yes gene_type:complete
VVIKDSIAIPASNGGNGYRFLAPVIGIILIDCQQQNPALGGA